MGLKRTEKQPGLVFGLCCCVKWVLVLNQLMDLYIHTVCVCVYFVIYLSLLIFQLYFINIVLTELFFCEAVWVSIMSPSVHLNCHILRFN